MCKIEMYCLYIHDLKVMDCAFLTAEVDSLWRIQYDLLLLFRRCSEAAERMDLIYSVWLIEC